MSQVLKSSLFVILLLSGSAAIFAQANLLNAKVPQEVGVLNEQQIAANDEFPIAYGYVDDRDVLWSKTIWEVIDLDERVNFPYYYPTDTLNLGPDRRSLFDVLKKSLSKDQITEVYKSSYFQEKLSYKEIQERLVATGAYAPNGIPNADGFVDYYKMINARDGGIGGEKIIHLVFDNVWVN